MLDVSRLRQQFPALERRVGGAPAIFFDGPAGSQVPVRVADAVRNYLLHTNANTHGAFASALESDAVIDEARRAVADLLGASDPSEVVFGPNMTTLTLSLSRALALTWLPGDEIVVTQLDHDADVTPWVLAARDAGAVVQTVPIRPDTTLDLDALGAALSSRTRLVAVTAASNATGTLTPLPEIARAVHDAGSELFVNAVHYGPHGLIDVGAWQCDYLACSAYKFFGPHVGILWGRRERMRSLPVYKVRPADDTMPGRFETGTQSHEGIAGTLAAVDYLAELGRTSEPGTPTRRDAIAAAYRAIGEHERALCARLLTGLARLRGYRVWGLADPERVGDRAPTVSITHARTSPQALAQALAARGIFVWHGNYYAVELSQALGREPDGMVRIGLLHYNTAGEVDRLLEALADLDQKA